SRRSAAPGPGLRTPRPRRGSAPFEAADEPGRAGEVKRPRPALLGGQEPPSLRGVLFEQPRELRPSLVAERLPERREDLRLVGQAPEAVVGGPAQRRPQPSARTPAAVAPQQAFAHPLGASGQRPVARAHTGEEGSRTPRAGVELGEQGRALALGVSEGPLDGPVEGRRVVADEGRRVVLHRARAPPRVGSQRRAIDQALPRRAPPRLEELRVTPEGLDAARELGAAPLPRAQEPAAPAAPRGAVVARGPRHGVGGRAGGEGRAR
ncbi:MAG: hypothetical protein D6731_11565, partial [Planctomycetota bacterium]